MELFQERKSAAHFVAAASHIVPQDTSRRRVPSFSKPPSLESFAKLYCGGKYFEKWWQVKDLQQWNDAQLAVWIYTLDEPQVFRDFSDYMRSGRLEDHWELFYFYFMKGVRSCPIVNGVFFRGIAAVPNNLPWCVPEAKLQALTCQSCSKQKFTAIHLASINKKSFIYKLFNEWTWESGDKKHLLQFKGPLLKILSNI